MNSSPVGAGLFSTGGSPVGLPYLSTSILLQISFPSLFYFPLNFLQDFSALTSDMNSPLPPPLGLGQASHCALLLLQLQWEVHVHSSSESLVFTESVSLVTGLLCPLHSYGQRTYRCSKMSLLGRVHGHLQSHYILVKNQ